MNLYLLKSNLLILNISISVLLFSTGVIPLFLPKDHPSRSNPRMIELMTLFAILLSILLWVLNIYAKKPLFKNNECLQIKPQYHNLSNFKKLNSIYNKPALVLAYSDGYYLIKQGGQLNQINAVEDFKYKRANCSE